MNTPAGHNTNLFQIVGNIPPHMSRGWLGYFCYYVWGAAIFLPGPVYYFKCGIRKGFSPWNSREVLLAVILCFEVYSWRRVYVSCEQLLKYHLLWRNQKHVNAQTLHVKSYENLVNYYTVFIFADYKFLYLLYNRVLTFSIVCHKVFYKLF